MRGRKPDVLTIVSPDISELERIAHSDALPWQVSKLAVPILVVCPSQPLATQSSAKPANRFMRPLHPRGRITCRNILQQILQSLDVGRIFFFRPAYGHHQAGVLGRGNPLGVVSGLQDHGESCSGSCR